MSKVKIRFSIEIDDETVISHSIEQSDIFHFNDERKFALDVINKMNCFYTEKNLYRENWIDLVRARGKIKKCQQEVFMGDA